MAIRQNIVECLYAAKVRISSEPPSLSARTDGTASGARPRYGPESWADVGSGRPRYILLLRLHIIRILRLHVHHRGGRADLAVAVDHADGDARVVGGVEAEGFQHR